MLRRLLSLATLLILSACGLTEPNVVDCGDDCPDVSGAGRDSGGSGGTAARDGGAGQSGSGSGGRGGSAGAADGGGQGGTAGEGGAGDGGAGDGGAGDGGGACGSCPDALPHCAGTTCVQCSQDEHCEDGVCVDQQCVACRAHGDCADPAASRCSSAAECIPCAQPEHCMHLDGTTTCDLGECVQCTGADSDACGRDDHGVPYVCDALARTCTTYTRGSANLCDACLSDGQCMDGQLCVMQRFDEVGDDPDLGEVDVGYFCFWREDATETGAPAGSCAQAPPYFGTRANSESIEGVEATVCGLRVTTCAAYKDYSMKTCTGAEDDASCGDPRFASDGYCREAATSTYRCTTPC